MVQGLSLHRRLPALPAHHPPPLPVHRPPLSSMHRSDLGHVAATLLSKKWRAPFCKRRLSVGQGLIMCA